MKKVFYSEGDVFAVPLRNGGFCFCLIVRKSTKEKIVFGYFFGPKVLSLNEESIPKKFIKNEALMRVRFGDLAIINKEWPKVGTIPFSKSEWEMPMFVQEDLLTQKKVLVQYSEEDLVSPVQILPVSEHGISNEKAICFGSGAVEISLTKILG